MKIGDFYIAYKKCKYCGHGTVKNDKPNNKRWKCGRSLIRDFSDKWLIKENKRKGVI